MTLDSVLSLEVVITILAILGAVWRLETRIADTRKELKGDIQGLDAKIDDVSQRLETRIADTRNELRGDIQRLDAKIDDVRQRLETKIENVDAKVDGVRDRVDEGNQRLARLEGRFEGRAERLASEGETSPAT